MDPIDTELAINRERQRDLRDSIERLRRLNQNMSGVLAVIERKRRELSGLVDRDRELVAEQQRPGPARGQSVAEVRHVGQLWAGWRA